MTKLYIEVYLDEDVSVLIADLVRSRGFSVMTASEAGLLGVDDATQLAFATSQGRAIVSHNRRDFEDLAVAAFASGQTHHGIIIAYRRPAHEVANRLLALLNAYTSDEMVDQLRYI